MNATTLFFCLLFISFCLPHANAQVSVLGSLAKDHDAQPGDTYNGQIMVRNDTDQPVQARIYQTDYMFFHDGTNYFDDPGTTERSNATWVQFNPSTLTLPARETGTVNYVVSVPDEGDTTSLNGTYWSMLMVEGIPKDAPESTIGDGDKHRFGIRQVTRYGVQIATHVRRTETVSIEIESVEIKKDAQGRSVLHLSFENTGNILIVPETWIELYEGDGAFAGRIGGSQSRVYPGTSVAHLFDLSGTPAGSYDALIVVDGGNDNIFGAQYTVNL